jgi:hypothetical protein
VELAATYSCPIWKAKYLTPSSDIPKWVAYFERKVNAFDPLHYYLAQIALEVRRSINPKKARNLKVEHFLFKFAKKGPPKKLTRKEILAAGEAAKAAMKARLARIKPKKPPKRPIKRLQDG